MSNIIRVSPSGQELTYPASQSGKVLAVAADGTVQPAAAAPLLDYGASNSGQRLVVQPSGLVSPSSGSFPIVTSAIGAVQGDVIRLAGAVAGVYVPAQADSNLNAAGTIGVLRGTYCVPFSECDVVNFESAPVVGQPCYVSATVAGKMTSTAPVAGAIAVPIGLIVQRDTSSGGLFSAQVAESGSLASSLSVDQQFVADAASALGILPIALHYQSLDFDDLLVSGFPTLGASIVVIPPAATHLNLTPPRSCISFVGNNGGAGGYAAWVVELSGAAGPGTLNVLQNTSVANQSWFLRFKFQATALVQTFGIWLDKGAGNETIGVALAQDVDLAWKLFAIHGNFNPMAIAPSVAQRTFLEADNTNEHMVTMFSLGDGSVHLYYDSQPALVIPLPASISPVAPRFVVESISCQMNLWQFGAP